MHTNKQDLEGGHFTNRKKCWRIYEMWVVIKKNSNQRIANFGHPDTPTKRTEIDIFCFSEHCNITTDDNMSNSRGNPAIACWLGKEQAHHFNGHNNLHDVN